jgi:hypothetical protein
VAHGQFSNYWSTIQTKLISGQALPSWSVAARTKSTFHILKVEPTSVVVAPQHGKPRRISRRDFERIFRVWPSYKAETTPRHELGFTQHSTYIITLLHWAETKWTG